MTTQKILSLSLIVAACFAMPSSTFAGRRSDRVAIRQMSRQAKQSGCRLMTHREALSRAAAADVAERHLYLARQSEKQLTENLAVAQAEIVAMQEQLAALTAKNDQLAANLSKTRKQSQAQAKKINGLQGTVKNTSQKLAKEQAGRKADGDLAKAEKAKAAKAIAASQQQLKQAQTQLAKVTQDVTARNQTITQLQQSVKALEAAAMKSETPKVEAAKPADADTPAQPEKTEESPQST